MDCAEQQGYGDAQHNSGRLSEPELLQQYLPLIKRCVSSLRSHCGTLMDLEDMEQIAMMALLEAGRRYPGEYDPGFVSFAGQRIRGAILDELRRQDWRPRPVRQQAHELNDTIRQLTRSLGREPSDTEVAAHLGIAQSEYRQRLYAIQAESMASLDELLGAGHDPSQEEGSIDQFVRYQTLEAAISKLSKRDQVILSLYYQHELNLKEIAATLGLTETRICQLHKAAVKQLHGLYRDWR
ncbi:RNA polymerase sigma factor for flagellar operon [Shewanella sp. NFH-SH190041]|uniref:RNA polymerase sigma factor FliA n=1 Tax=Shewanella sp. NFH-SH190041 TaxID=2950245 RepID=UPI0021C4627B|nr:RNA polymerase sigma factor FliA [Shewanella sp. NFH-SH190041]BDM62702.1 RNA polymerase sigma factor for flagellar operon [Shewanella sp. NFH-SH190041]